MIDTQRRTRVAFGVFGAASVRRIHVLYCIRRRRWLNHRIRRRQYEEHQSMRIELYRRAGWECFGGETEGQPATTVEQVDDNEDRFLIARYGNEKGPALPRSCGAKSWPSLQPGAAPRNRGGPSGR